MVNEQIIATEKYIEELEGQVCSYLDLRYKAARYHSDSAQKQIDAWLSTIEPQLKNQAADLHISYVDEVARITSMHRPS